MMVRTCLFRITLFVIQLSLSASNFLCILWTFVPRSCISFSSVKRPHKGRRMKTQKLNYWTTVNRPYIASANHSSKPWQWNLKYHRASVWEQCNLWRPLNHSDDRHIKLKIRNFWNSLFDNKYNHGTNKTITRNTINNVDPLFTSDESALWKSLESNAKVAKTHNLSS